MDEVLFNSLKMTEPGRDGELTLFNRPQPLEAMESLNPGARASAECQPLCVASWGVVPPLPCPAPPPRTPAPGGYGATEPGRALPGTWGDRVRWRIFYFILLWDCSEVAETWEEAAHFTWNLLGMTKGSVSCMLATFQGLPRWF